MADGVSPLLMEVQKQRKDLQLPELLTRDFQDVNQSVNNSGAKDSQPALRVMQWNLLAQALSMGDDNFVLCPDEALQWEHRKLHILEEILTYNATIVCLEEVDHFTFLKEMLGKAGYDGCFFPKPDSPCLYSDINYGPDGCAVFWKTDQVSLMNQRGVVLKLDSGEDTNQVSLICKFTHLALKREFFIAVTHFKSKTPYWQLRLEQGKYLEQTLTKTVGPSVPLVVCGDFNAEPSEQVYTIFKNSQLKLQSAYCFLSDKMEEPTYTTWKVRGGLKGKENKESKQCIDYVFFTKDYLQPVSLLKMPSGEQIGKDRLPSMTYPSDHLSLVVDFTFCS